MSAQYFDPSGVGQVTEGLFGFPYSVSEAKVVVLPVPWDVTTSYRPGTANGPSAIAAASPQLDFFDQDYPRLWEFSVAMAEISKDWLFANKTLRVKAEQIIHALETGNPLTESHTAILAEINVHCAQLHHWVMAQSEQYQSAGQFVVVLGGEHSVAYGNIVATAKRFPNMGLLQIDAHQDLRDAYLGFEFSHASVMKRVLTDTSVTKLVQVGIRDCSPDEIALANSDSRVAVFSNKYMQGRLFEGESWQSIVDEIISGLPQHVYLSIDVDGLDPSNCPHTGTPVPGGLSFDQLAYLLKRLSDSAKTLVGADLVEVAPGPEGDDWDANVGARVLWQMLGCIRRSKLT